MAFGIDVLKIDPTQEMEKLSKFIMEQVKVVFRRKGIIVVLVVVLTLHVWQQ